MGVLEEVHGFYEGSIDSKKVWRCNHGSWAAGLKACRHCSVLGRGSRDTSMQNRMSDLNKGWGIQ